MVALHEYEYRVASTIAEKKTEFCVRSTTRDYRNTPFCVFVLLPPRIGQDGENDGWVV
jgi:hypothetical protein